MANRSKPETKPIISEDEKTTSAVIDEDLRSKPHSHPVIEDKLSKGQLVASDENALSNKDFGELSYFLKTMDYKKSLVVRTETHNALKRLMAKRDLKKAPGRTSKNSKSFDLDSVFSWLRSILPEQTKAVGQVIALDAIVCNRQSPE